MSKVVFGWTRLRSLNGFVTGTQQSNHSPAMNRGFEGYIVPVHLSPALFDARFRQVHLDLAASRILVASGKPVGLCLISRRGWSSYVAAAGVAPEYRGAGIARELMQECIRESRARGERRMLLEVIAGNEPAVRLYGKLGFVAKRRLVGYVQTAALPEESNDTHVAELPRLRFHFDRRNLGRLRQLVDLINREG